MPNQGYYEALAKAAAEQVSDDTVAALERAERAAARQRREERLRDRPAFPGPAITPEDKTAIIRGTLSRDIHALNLVMSWWERFYGHRPGAHIPIVVMLGATGRGKTVAGSWLIAEEGGVYVSALEMVKRLCTKHPRDANWCSDVLGARVTVLDDVGTEFDFDHDAAIAAMFEFVNRRYALARAFTLITTNLTFADFQARYGERTVHRVMHVGRFVEAKGEDLRRKT